MDKHIFTCDTDNCEISKGFVYIYLERESITRTQHYLQLMKCPSCEKKLRWIESFDEEGYLIDG